MKTKFILLFLLCLAMAACRKAPGGQTATREGDTIRLKYAQKLTIVKHKEYTEVKLSDPWNIGKTLHTPSCRDRCLRAPSYGHPSGGRLSPPAYIADWSTSSDSAMR